jgi:hypothetical protein
MDVYKNDVGRAVVIKEVNFDGDTPIIIKSMS